MPNKQCARCKKWKASKNIKSKIHAWCHPLLQSEGISFDANENLFLCNQCWFDLRNKKKQANIQIQNENTNDVEDMDAGVHEEEDLLTFENIIFAGSGHSKCVVCRAEVHTGAVVMPKPARLDLLVPKRMYAPRGVRCCTGHLWNNRLLPDVEIHMGNQQTPVAKLDPSVLLQLFNDLLGLLQEASTAARLNFTDPSLSNEDYLAWT